MAILLITYDLNVNGQDYKSIIEIIKKAQDYKHFMKSNWFVKTSLTPEDWCKKIKPIIDENDYLFIVDITKQPRQGWLKKDVWEWLNKNDA
ncbi:hypothetical protein [Aquimarina sp. SS2-1]|uniref:hypothetical protein n=1 Tax=Aquimarina besae TaxID=3342247 RepID=UPI003672BCAE